MAKVLPGTISVLWSSLLMLACRFFPDVRAAESDFTAARERIGRGEMPLTAHADNGKKGYSLGCFA
jgi:hypothetical protein